MKQFVRTLFAAGIAAMAFVSCAQNELTPDVVEGKKVTVHFGTENTDPTSTKATLTPIDGEKAFQAAWEVNDEISISYSFNYADPSITTGKWIGSSFEATISGEKGDWMYEAAYPVPVNNYVDFGSNRTQKGNAYNSKYDIMIGSALAENAEAGKDEAGKDIVFKMDRQTAIAYFHFTSGINEAIKKATLKVEGDNAAIAAETVLLDTKEMVYETGLSEIVLTTTDQTADDFTLWFNVLPTSYTKMTLTVETATKTFTISKATSGSYVAGKLYKVKKEKISWKDKPETPSILFFYESFDTNTSTGGNDGTWNGITGTPTLSYDNDGWTSVKGYGANNCARFGSSSAIGSATSPSLGINTSEATLWFKAGTWKDDTANTIKISIVGEGTVSPAEITLGNAAWTEYFCTISGANAETKVKISANTGSKNRFFLDEVYVYYGSKPVVKSDQMLSFDETSFSINVGADFTAPTLNGAKTTVTYSSNKEDVASVNSATGEVTIVGAGTAIIKASAEETDEYRAATATYKITVNKLSQTLSFEKSSYNVVFANKEDFVSPVVSGIQTTVSYSISLSEETAADAIVIDSETGKLTINAIGKATVTATATSSETYESASASYSLTVSNEEINATTLTLSNFSFTSAEEVSIDTKDENVSIKAYKGNAGTNPYNADGTIRLYQGSSSKYGGYITISVNKGVKLKSVEIESSSSYATTVASKVDSNAESDHVTLAKSSSYKVPGINETGAESVSIYCYGTSKTARLEIAKITVIYE